ncbi:MAG TPA: PAS domain S-box protein, partial [Gemmatales bacterium]|nr:PAS domain S-box protein [Gemmatales bacterium]
QGAHEFTKQIIEYAQEGIVVYDRQLRIQVWNRYLEQISNVSARDVLGKTTEEAFPFLKDHVILERIQRPLTGEVVKVKSARFDDPQTGVARWTAAGYAPLRNPQGEIIGVVGTIQEITDRKLEEERVAANNQRMALILDQIPSILWTTDIRLVFTTSTGSGLSVFDLSPELVIGKSLYDYMQTHDPANPTILAHINALKGYSTCYDVEFRGRIFNVTVVPLRSAAGEIIGTIGLAQDITENCKREQEQRELEDRIQQAQKLESLEVLAGGVAHDFNNLLTGMLGYASLAMSELPVNSPVMPMLQGIEKAAQRAAELSRQMLAYSGKGKFVIEAVALDVLVLEMTRLLKTLISPRAQLHVTAEPALIEGDATQIRQVVMNLITNAADAIPPDGMITIRCGSREFNQPELRSDFMQSELNPGPYAYIEVQDNGSGISPENYRKIFDPFFTTKFTGRGLGLASVRGIVRGHGGIIQVKSSQPGGTLFRVIL